MSVAGRRRPRCRCRSSPAGPTRCRRPTRGYRGGASGSTRPTACRRRPAASSGSTPRSDEVPYRTGCNQRSRHQRADRCCGERLDVDRIAGRFHHHRSWQHRRPGSTGGVEHDPWLSALRYGRRTTLSSSDRYQPWVNAAAIPSGRGTADQMEELFLALRDLAQRAWASVRCVDGGARDRGVRGDGRQAQHEHPRKYHEDR